MKQYVGIFRVPVEVMDEWKRTTSPEEMQAQEKKLGEDMMAWVEKYKASFVGQGIPLGKTKRVTKDGVVDTRNDLNYMQVVEAESHEAACKIFADSVHVTIPNAYLDVMEVPHMGM
jgi:hypothetical protein